MAEKKALRNHLVVLGRGLSTGQFSGETWRLRVHSVVFDAYYKVYPSERRVESPSTTCQIGHGALFSIPIYDC